MGTADLFARIRSLNTQALSAAARIHEPCYLEPALRLEDGSVAVEGRFDLPYRCDIVPEDADGNQLESVMVDPPAMVRFEPYEEVVDNIPVEICPFGWDYVDIRARFPKRPQVDAITAWFWRWYDAEDSNTADELGLFGVVHFMSDPKYTKGELCFTVDLGSSPVSALDELLSVLAEMGAERVVVG